MSEIDQIIQISLSRQSTPVSTASFQIPMILTSHTKFSERARTYTDFDAVAADFDSTDNAYIIAQRIFGQQGARIPSVVIGRRQVDEVEIVPDPVADNTVYSVTVNGVVYSFTSGTSATATTITAGLDAAIGSPAGVNVEAVGGVLTIGVATPGADWSVVGSSNLEFTSTAPTESWVEALDAVTQFNNTWYALVAETHVQADVIALAAAIQTRRKIYGTSTQDATVPTSSTTDIGYLLDAGNYGRTFITYLPTADTEYPEAAWIGSQLAYTPGSNDWDFKRGALITSSNITDSQRAFLRSKNVNMYTEVGGVDVFQDGNMADGLPIDLKQVA